MYKVKSLTKRIQNTIIIYLQHRKIISINSWNWIDTDKLGWCWQQCSVSAEQLFLHYGIRSMSDSRMYILTDNVSRFMFLIDDPNVEFWLFVSGSDLILRLHLLETAAWQVQFRMQHYCMEVTCDCVFRIHFIEHNFYNFPCYYFPSLFLFENSSALMEHGLCLDPRKNEGNESQSLRLCLVPRKY